MLRVAPEDYWRVIEPLRALAINTLFARTVVELGARGEVFVDCLEGPSSVYVVHPYGMSLLFGKGIWTLRDEAISRLLYRARASSEWLQVFPEDWAGRVDRLPRSAAFAAIERYTRVNFRFSPDRYRALRARIPAPGHTIVRVDEAIFGRAGSVVPRLFWDDAEHFLREGSGFAVMVDGEPASVAFSSFVLDSELELGIETSERHRGKGLAIEACVALVDECLSRGLTPVWSCRLENTASYRLAQRLGFEPVLHLPYFRLPPTRSSASEQSSEPSEERAPCTN